MKNVITRVVTLLSSLWLFSIPSLTARSIEETMRTIPIDYSHQASIFLQNEGITIHTGHHHYALAFGMSRQEIEEILGKGDTYPGLQKPFFRLDSHRYASLGLTLHYHQNHLVLISVSPSESNLNFQISLGDLSFAIHDDATLLHQHLHAYTDQSLPHHYFRINNNYLKLYHDNRQRVSVVHYGSAFFAHYLQPNDPHFVVIKMTPNGLFIQDQLLRFGMNEAEVQALLGPSDQEYFLMHSFHPRPQQWNLNPPQEQELQVLTYYHLASELIFDEHGLVSWHHLVAPTSETPSLPIVHVYNIHNTLILNTLDYYHHFIDQLPSIYYSHPDLTQNP